MDFSAFQAERYTCLSQIVTLPRTINNKTTQLPNQCVPKAFRAFRNADIASFGGETPHFYPSVTVSVGFYRKVPQTE